MRRRRKIRRKFLGFDGAAALYAAWRASCVVPDAWEDWRGYRRQVTDYVLENSLPGTTLAIFGAGRCNDLELERLLGHFSQVTLLDLDEEAMLEAAGRCAADGGAGSAARLHLCTVDFVGLCPEDYIRFADVLLRRLSRKGAVDGELPIPTPLEFLHDMHKKSKSHTLALPEPSYDYTIALGVHSQLGNLPAWLVRAAEAGRAEANATEAGRVEANAAEVVRAKENAAETVRAEANAAEAGRAEENTAVWRQEKEELLRQIKQETTFLSERFTTWMLSATKTKAFLGCEQSRALLSAGAWYAVPDSAVAGAWQAAEHVGRLAAAGQVRFEHYLDIVWPFCVAEGKAYRMMVMEVEKTL